jgi:hypothetical protein
LDRCHWTIEQCGAQSIGSGSLVSFCSSAVGLQPDLVPTEIAASTIEKASGLAATHPPPLTATFGTMWSLAIRVAAAANCSGNDAIQTITKRCTPAGDPIDIKYTIFVDCFGEAAGLRFTSVLTWWC